MEAGNLAAGCPALEDSYRLDPKAGALFALADCTARWGKTATAVAHYQDYLGVVSRLPDEQRARHADREALARQEIERLRSQVPELTLFLPANAPPNTVVTRDGVELGAAELQRAGDSQAASGLPIDPGNHVVTTRVPGGAERVVEVALAPGEKKTVILEVELPPPPAPPRPAPVRPSAAPQPLLVEPAPPRPNHTAAWLLGGVGVAAIGAGSVTGILVLGKKSIVDTECQGHDCTPRGKSAADTGKTLALVTDVCMGVGVAAVATSAVLLLTGGSRRSDDHPVSARLAPVVVAGPGGALAFVRARW